MSTVAWYTKLDDIVAEYGVVQNNKYSFCPGVNSYSFNGQWIFDHYAGNDFAFMNYNKEANCLLLESSKQYDYFSFTRKLTKTIKDVKTYQMKCKLEEISEDFV